MNLDNSVRTLDPGTKVVIKCQEKLKIVIVTSAVNWNAGWPRDDTDWYIEGKDSQDGLAVYWKQGIDGGTVDLVENIARKVRDEDAKQLQSLEDMRSQVAWDMQYEERGEDIAKSVQQLYDEIHMKHM